jgi:hypothetical protein
MTDRESRDRLIELIDKAVKQDEFMYPADVETASIADHLLANGVIVSPCKFQQKVYVLPTKENSLDDITEMKCIGFILSCDCYGVNLITDKNKLYQPSFDYFGKTVFLTKEEAEEKLKELE